MPRIAFATFAQQPEVASDDAPVAEALRESGATVSAAVWDAADVPWSAFDVVILRSTWDYHEKAKQFADWIQTFLIFPSRMWNPPGAVLWNMNKRYLLDLAAQGVATVPTEHLSLGSDRDLRAILAGHGWEEAVVKPAVGLGSFGAWRTGRLIADADQARLAAQVATQDVLVQPFVPEVASRGEWSFVFFGSHYSHAVLKRPRLGDFRVQEHAGGTTMAAIPSGKLIEDAQAVLAAVGHSLLYARVDGIERDGRLLLMELEIIEPSLFLALEPGAARQFAVAIMRRLSSGETGS